MNDIFTREKRSAVMSAIRSDGNCATELRLIAVFRAPGITGWRRGGWWRWRNVRS
jgi:G:T-mismatch repair DNA endonuclease (very short patch repair protein)